jgi:hypothetical protein
MESAKPLGTCHVTIGSFGTKFRDQETTLECSDRITFLCKNYHFILFMHINYIIYVKYVRFEVLTVLVMKSSTFWDIMPCVLLRVNLCFGRTCRLHLQGITMSEARNHHEPGSKKRLTFNRLHGVISQKIKFLYLVNYITQTTKHCSIQLVSPTSSFIMK